METASVKFSILDDATKTMKKVEQSVIASTKKMSKAEAEYAIKIAKTNTQIFELKQEMANASKERQKDIKDEIKSLNILQQANKNAYSQAKKDSGNGGLQVKSSPLSDMKGELLGLATNPYALAGAALTGIYTVTEKVLASQDIWRQRIQGTESDYEKLGEQTLKISNVFSKNNDEIAKAGNAFSKSFGIDAKEGLDIIYEGFKKGADMNGLFLDNLTEYSIQAKEAGMTTEQFVGFLIAAEKEGIYSDKGIDSIKEAGLRLRKNEKASMDAIKPLKAQVQEQIKIAAASGNSFEAMKLITGELDKGYLSAQQVQAIMSDVLGGAGEDAGGGIVKVLSNANIELSSMQTNLSANQLATIALKEEWSGFESSVGNVFDSAIIGIKSGVINIVKFVKDNKDIFDKIILGYKFLSNPIGTIQGLFSDNEKKFNDINQEAHINDQLKEKRKELSTEDDKIKRRELLREIKELETEKFKLFEEKRNKNKKTTKETKETNVPKEGDKNSDGTQIFKNGKWVLINKNNNTKIEKNTGDTNRSETKSIANKTTQLSESRIVRSINITIDKAVNIEGYQTKMSPTDLGNEVSKVIAQKLATANEFIGNV